MGKQARISEIIKSEKDIEVIRCGNTKYRVGYCSQCGECCQSINMDTKGSKTAIDWLELHNVKVTTIGAITKDPREEATEFTLSISLPCPCKELKYITPLKHFRCNIYKDRPVICQMYPKQTIGYKTCTYMFLNTEELEKFSQEYTNYWRNTHGQEKTIQIAN